MIMRLFYLIALSFIAISYQNCAPMQINEGLNLQSSNQLSTGPVEFAAVEALLAAKCLGCHTGASLSNGNIDLSGHNAILDSGSVLPSDSIGSSLYQVVANQEMPPLSPLNASEISLIKSWIDQGAQGPILAANRLPVVMAGQDVTVTVSATQASFVGMATDSDGTIVSLSWRQASGPNTATVSGTTTTNLTVSGFVQGTYVFELRAVDNRGGASTDTVQLIVQASGGGGNASPVVNAGADQIVSASSGSVTFAATANDPDGSIANRTWRQVSGPNTATLAGVSTLNLVVTNFVVGTYVFELSVRDNQGAMATDRVMLTVNAAVPVRFADVSSMILVPRCLNCHGPTRAAGGYSVATYAQVMRAVTAGNAGQSSLYVEVQSDSMPDSGAPLTNAQKTMIQTWINQGALNN